MAKKNKRAIQSAPISIAPAARQEFNPDYTYVKKDLTRIGILSGIIFVTLIALSFFIN